MIEYSKLQNLTLNRTKIALPKMSKNKGMVIFVCSKDENGAFDIIDNTKMYRNIDRVKNYFIDRKYNIKVFNKSINDKYDTKDRYARVLDNTRISTTARDFNILKGKNAFVDLYKYYEYLMEYKKNYTGDRVVTEFFKLYTPIINKYSEGYTTPIMVIDLHTWGNDMKDSNSYKLSKADTPVEFMYEGLFKHIDLVQAIKCDILIVDGIYSVLIKPSECDATSYVQLKKALYKMKDDIKTDGSNNIIAPEDETPEEKEQDTKESVQIQVKDNITDKVISTLNRTVSDDDLKYSFTGDEESLKNMIDSKVKDVIDDESDDLITADTDEVEEQVEDKLNQDTDFLKQLELAKMKKVTGESSSNLKRNKMLMQKQAEIRVNGTGKTMQQILDEMKNETVVPEKVPIKTINPVMQTLTSPTYISRQYNDKLLNKDTLDIINCFKDKRLPIYILDVKKEDSSDEFNKKFTYTIKMEGADRTRHTLKFDFPKFINDSFMYLGGNKKNIITQFMLKPVSKTGPNTVQICTDYNKVFMHRTGTKLSPKIERLKKTLNQYAGATPMSDVYFTTGDSVTANSDYLTTIEYDELSQSIFTLYLLKKSIEIYFNQNNIREELKLRKIPFKSSDYILPIGIKNGKEVIYYDINKDKVVGTNYSIADYIINVLGDALPNFKSDLNKASTGKRFIYTIAVIMKKKIPLLFLLAYLEGLTTLLKKAKINYKFSDTRVVLQGDDKNNKGIIEFADGYLIYDKYPMCNSLLLNAITLIPTKAYNYSDFDSKEIYLDIFQQLFGVKMIANVFENFYDLLIDPTAKIVLKDCGMPIDFLELFLYANTLLEDNHYVKENNMSLYRMRRNEITNAILYKRLATAYEKYRGSAGNKNPEKLSIPQDQVIKDILMSNIVEDYSTLNPVLESEKLGACSFKGPSGMNLARAYTLDKRSYDKSMKGIMAISSPPSGAVGVSRQLALSPNVISARGYLNINDDDSDKLNVKNLYSAAELLVPTTANNDDPQRVAMATGQTKHVVPTKKTDRLLVGNGAEKALAHIISDDFAFKAKDDGVVQEINDKLETIVVKYKNGDYDVIDMSNKISKNGGGGFYINNKLSSNLKLGEKFKKDDILASNEQFFKQEGSQTNYKIGTLAKIAVIEDEAVYEDSTTVSHKLSKEMATAPVMKKDTVLGKNSNVEYIIEKGQRVEVGEPLLIFDNSYDDEGLNKLLANLDKDTKNSIKNLGKTPVKSKYSGVIEDIKIYYTVEFNELSPSLQKIVNKLHKPVKDKTNLINKYKNINDTSVVLDPVRKTEAKYGKVKGVDVGEGVLIEFYIKYEDEMGVGDKITFFCALKATIGQLMPEGKEPFSEYRPDEEISALLGPGSIQKRMTPSILLNGFANKVLVELKQQLKEML